MLSRWNTELKSLYGPWHWSNNKMQLGVIHPLGKTGGPLSQSLVFENYAALFAAERKPVIYGSLADVYAAGRPVPTSSSTALILRDKAKSAQVSKFDDGYQQALISEFWGRPQKSEDSESEEDGDTKDGDPDKSSTTSPKLGMRLGGRTVRELLNDPRSRIPHLLWHIANEGQAISVEEFAERRKEPRKVSTLLLGTRRQWDDIVRDTDFEARFGLQQAFEVRESVSQLKTLNVI